MASTVLPNGIIIPEKYSRDWYNDLYHNWQELDNLLGGGTPKDGTLTIQKNGDTVGTFSANQATNETVNITVPDVNDATLTIQQNGTAVDTFTANSSTDKTVNIQCVDLTNNQTVGGIKTFSNAPVVNSISLDGKTIDTDANDNMTFNGHIVDTIEEQGNGYIRYSNGIQICWGSVTNNNNIDTGESIFALPKAFNNSLYSLILTAQSNAVYYASVMESGPGGTAYKTATQFGVFFCDRAMNLIGGPLSCNYIAIGTWK